MNELTDNDLILFYYGEHEDPQLGARIAASPALSARLNTLSQILEHADHAPVPSTPADIGERVWSAIGPRLAEASSGSAPRPGIWDWLTAPRLSLGGLAGLAVVALFAFMLGRQSAPPPPTEPAVAAIDANRLAALRTGQHLDEADLLLTAVSHERSDDGTATWARAMLESNRIYRLAALQSGNQQLARLLDDLEPWLIQLANQPEQAGQIDSSLLFRIRVMNQELSNDQAI